MKKVVLASLLAAASFAPLAQFGFAQPTTLGQQAAGGQVQMSAEEYAAYNNANTQTTPAAKAAAFEAYLKAYPNSAVKNDVLATIMFAYSQANDAQKTQAAADAVLASDPNNLPAYVFEAQLRMQSDPNGAADYAKKGLALGQPKGMDAGQFANIKANGYPVLYSAIGAAALNNKDSAAAVAAYKSELTSVPLAQTTTPGLELQDTYSLARAYMVATPPDLLNCAYYAARGMYYAPEPYKTTFKQLATYCYNRFHGSSDGFDAMVAVAKDNLDPPSTLNIKPAPKPADIVANLIATTPDLATLALSDKEYVIQNAAPVDDAKCKADPTKCKSDADKVFDTIKGKSVEVPGALVVEASDTQLKVAVSDDAKQAQPKPTADFVFNLKSPVKPVPAVGSTITLTGTYTSYTQSPLLITMDNAEIVEKKKAAPGRKAPPAHRAPAKRR